MTAAIVPMLCSFISYVNYFESGLVFVFVFVFVLNNHLKMNRSFVFLIEIVDGLNYISN